MLKRRFRLVLCFAHGLGASVHTHGVLARRTFRALIMSYDRPLVMCDVCTIFCASDKNRLETILKKQA